MSEVLIVNASPLIFLGNAGRLELLRGIGASRVVVPQTVFEEVTQSPHTDTAARAVLEAQWLERAPSVPSPQSVLEWDLGPGESAVVACSLTIPEACAVIDDLTGRKCALALGVDVVGTLGLVIAAHRRGHIPDARQVLHELRAAGMWLSDVVIERALQKAGVKP